MERWAEKARFPTTRHMIPMSPEQGQCGREPGETQICLWADAVEIGEVETVFADFGV